jgi:hypothetical protein
MIDEGAKGGVAAAVGADVMMDEAEIGAGVAAASASQNGGQNGQNGVSEAAGHWGRMVAKTVAWKV